jgi:beta-lactamase class A
MTITTAALLLAAALQTPSLNTTELERDLTALAAQFEGRMGVCVRTTTQSTCVRAQDRFSLQSVMKLLVAFAAMDAIDSGRWRLEDPVVVRKADLSLYVQPIAKLVGPDGYRTTIGDLVRRAVIDSDSAATDVLIARLGGTAAVTASMARHHIDGIRVDRDERDLQTEIVGLTWRPEFVDADLLDREIRQVPEARRDRAFAAYQNDPRDTATPAGMTAFLMRLVSGELLSRESTAFLLQAMKECTTFPDRLKAGVPASWEISHKTGTSGTWKGVTAATNDVGILRTPDGTAIAVSAFLADSPASSKERAATIAAVAALVVQHYQQGSGTR